VPAGHAEEAHDVRGVAQPRAARILPLDREQPLGDRDRIARRRAGEELGGEARGEHPARSQAERPPGGARKRPEEPWGILWRMDAARAQAAIEIRGAAAGLADDPLLLHARGAGPAEGLLWRARLRDDDGRVWRASAASAAALADAWIPAKATTGRLAALQSLRPLSIEVRAEAADGRAASRTLARALVGEGVRIRRWREARLGATLALPAAGAPPCATVAIDATAGPEAAAAGALAAALLASRGVLALVVPPPREPRPAAELLRRACERLAGVPGAGGEIAVLPALLPPGIPARADGGAAAPARAAAWDALLARLGARPRERDAASPQG
jgi:hypothetical protein